MRFALIVLLLAACAPVAVPSPAAQAPAATIAPAETPTASAQPLTIPAAPAASSQAGVAALLAQVSEARLRADLLTLQSFHTRHSASSTTDPDSGIGAARAWLSAQFRRISPRLRVESDDFAFTLGNRPVGAQNIIATLPGRAGPPQIIIISAHYDSRTVDITDVRSAAPGANDDGSGTVAVLELARALSQHDLDATLVFILFAGEEEGLYGSTHLAPLMRKQGAHIIAMLNDDIIGNTMGADGTRIADRVRVYSGEPDDGPSRQLAREVRRIAEAAMPGFGIELIPKIDRRAGDHIPFHYAGFPAVRFTEPNENLEHQHNANDRVEFMDIPYLAQVVRVNLAVALELGRVNRGQ